MFSRENIAVIFIDFVFLHTKETERVTDFSHIFEICLQKFQNRTVFIPLDKSPEDNGGKIQMKRKITLVNAVSLIVGSIIGSGIFVSPGGVLQYVGSGGMALLIWAICGILCTIGALCFSVISSSTLSGGKVIDGLFSDGDREGNNGILFPHTTIQFFDYFLLVMNATCRANNNIFRIK
ncbi:putative L-type amino acid transporter 1-like protein MLAS [Armadillidium vulgare]|nr:putative L-type amino acid transporter 1-like protein MLAS [Armadillidium vulgare]